MSCSCYTVVVVYTVCTHYCSWCSSHGCTYFWWNCCRARAIPHLEPCWLLSVFTTIHISMFQLSISPRRQMRQQIRMEMPLPTAIDIASMRFSFCCRTCAGLHVGLESVLVALVLVERSHWTEGRVDPDDPARQLWRCGAVLFLIAAKPCSISLISSCSLARSREWVAFWSQERSKRKRVYIGWWSALSNLSFSWSRQVNWKKICMYSPEAQL